MVTLHKQGPRGPESLSPQSLRRRTRLRIEEEGLLLYSTHLSFSQQPSACARQDPPKALGMEAKPMVPQEKGGWGGEWEGQGPLGLWSQALHSHIVLLVCCSSGQTEYFHFWSPSVRIHQATGFLFCTGFCSGVLLTKQFLKII